MPSLYTQYYIPHQMIVIKKHRHAKPCIPLIHSGSALAITLSFIALPLGLITYIWLRGLHRLTWDGWSWESLREWKQFVGLALPGLLMVCCELWCFEISAILAGAISDVQLGINSVMIQLLSNTFQVRVLNYTCMKEK